MVTNLKTIDTGKSLRIRKSLKTGRNGSLQKMDRSEKSQKIKISEKCRK